MASAPSTPTKTAPSRSGPTVLGLPRPVSASETVCWMIEASTALVRKDPSARSVPQSRTYGHQGMTSTLVADDRPLSRAKEKASRVSANGIRWVRSGPGRTTPLAIMSRAIWNSLVPPQFE